MSEMARTLTYAVAAAAVLGLGIFLGLPSAAPVEANAETGAFFADWNDPLAATSLEIIHYDEDSGTPHTFKVAQVNDRWSIPSHENYPADAQRQLAEAATSVMDLKKLGLASSDKSEHATFGVIDPDPKNLKAGETGVGKRVTLQGKEGKKLAQFIIGKEVKGQPGIRYVRVPGEDAVYRVEVKPEKLSTKFGDWIEKDLLKLNAFDIKQVVLNNYSVDELNGTVSAVDVIRLTYDDKDSKWSLDGAAEGEELETTKLNDLKTALDDLKIVDVRAKPEGLSTELKKEEGRLTPQDMRNLAGKGFFFDQQGRLLSNEGEVVTRMKDGVVYVLRFGQIAANTGDVAEKADDPAKADALDQPEKKDEATGSNRYIFVSAQFDPNSIAKLELEPLPGESPADDKPAKEPADADKKDAAADKAAEEKKEDKAADDKAEKKDGAASDDEADAAKQKKKELELQRKEIEKQNKRKQDEYDEKIKKGEERVKELNARFADWYYVISDDVYRKIHLSRADIIKAGKPPADTSPAALDKIKEQVLQADAAAKDSE